MTEIIAVCNQKGGVGKTTLTINLGAALADTGKRVLLVDLDPQGHLTEGVGMKDLYLSEGRNLYQSLTQSKGALIPLSELIQPVPHEKFSLLPSHYQMMLAEQGLFMARNREHKLKTLFDNFTGQFDFILVDCPPNLGNLTDNALNAARKVIIPVQAETTSVRALELLFDQIESIEQGLKIHITVLAIVPNLVQESALARRILGELRASIPAVTPLELRKRVVLQEAYDQGKSIFSYQPQKGSTKVEDCQELKTLYLKLADLVIKQTQE